MTVDQIFARMTGAETASARLDALQEMTDLYRNGTLEVPQSCGNVNNHIHTTFSFSPYSPAAAAYMAWKNGLVTAGIMDHDSLAGAREFIRAGEILELATTIGFECRVDFSKTPFGDRRLNNPDQDGVAYVTLHGIPHGNIDAAEAFLAPYREKRNLRNRKMTDNLNALLAPLNISVDFDRDILPLSQAAAGGSVTERHLLFAVAGKLMERYPDPAEMIAALRGMGVAVSAKAEAQQLDPANPFKQYDLLGVLKGNMVEKFYIPATEECPDVTEFLRVAEKLGGIAAYAYLGDVGDSVTGDKKAQAFEDAFLDDLIPYIKELGFRAVTYMPTRNTPAQLSRLRKLCQDNDLFEISGEDINSPRQSFQNPLILTPDFAHLVRATWALIGHERAATLSQEDGMFTPETLAAMPTLEERTEHFAKIGLQ
ncbi:MAG: PHP domain-containing protein [Ruminococcaceae bacterium]|nr:PHP domain-containing protein [Oscillospiraceae bacterium]